MAQIWNIVDGSFKATVEVSKIGDLFLAKGKKLIQLGLKRAKPEEKEAFGELLSGAIAEEEEALQNMRFKGERLRKQKRRVSNLKKLYEFYKTI